MQCPYCGGAVSGSLLEGDGMCPSCEANLGLVEEADDVLGEDGDEWVDLEEAADYTQISEGTLLTYIENGDLEYEKEPLQIGSPDSFKYWISVNSLHELLERRGRVLEAKLKGKSRKGGQVRKIVGQLPSPDGFGDQEA